MGIDLFAYNDNIILDLCEYTAKYNLTSAEDVEMPFEPYYHPKYGWHEKVSADGKGRARPGWELLYNHYAKVKGMHEDPAGKVKGRHLAQSQEMGRDQGHATLNVGLHAYFCRTAYNMVYEQTR